MKVFVAGASGAIGRPLIERLTRGGHEVTGMIRRAEGADQLRQLGAEPVQVDAFDRDAVRASLWNGRNPPLSSTSSPHCQRARLISPRHCPLTAGSASRVAATCSPRPRSGVQRYIQQSSGFYLAAQDGLADKFRLRCASMRPAASAPAR